MRSLLRSSAQEPGERPAEFLHRQQGVLDAMFDLQRLVAKTPARTTSELRAKARVLGLGHGGVWAPALVASLLKDVERLAASKQRIAHF